MKIHRAQHYPMPSTHTPHPRQGPNKLRISLYKNGWINSAAGSAVHFANLKASESRLDSWMERGSNTETACYTVVIIYLQSTSRQQLLQRKGQQYRSQRTSPAFWRLYRIIPEAESRPVFGMFPTVIRIQGDRI